MSNIDIAALRMIADALDQGQRVPSVDEMRRYLGIFTSETVALRLRLVANGLVCRDDETGVLVGLTDAGIRAIT